MANAACLTGSYPGGLSPQLRWLSCCCPSTFILCPQLLKDEKKALQSFLDNKDFSSHEGGAKPEVPSQGDAEPEVPSPQGDAEPELPWPQGDAEPEVPLPQGDAEFPLSQVAVVSPLPLPREYATRIAVVFANYKTSHRVRELSRKYVGLQLYP